MQSESEYLIGVLMRWGDLCDEMQQAVRDNATPDIRREPEFWRGHAQMAGVLGDSIDEVLEKVGRSRDTASGTQKQAPGLRLVVDNSGKK